MRLRPIAVEDTIAAERRMERHLASCEDLSRIPPPPAGAGPDSLQPHYRAFTAKPSEYGPATGRVEQHRLLLDA